MGRGNPENLRRAAQAKREAALARAENGLRASIKRGEPITFEGVAAAGGVSKDFLYRTTDLRCRIVELREQQSKRARTPDRPVPEAQRDTSSVIRTLTTKLTEERARHRAEVSELKAALAAAHGRLLELSRAPSDRNTT
ncbi:hypothetical protein SAMN06295974_1312 [Plantibacter flavus]|nr:hypothetical protein SAMN06295974_1312 [Plantibacter flavus]